MINIDQPPVGGLLARMRANLCAVVGCERQRLTDAVLCRDDLGRDYRHELDRQPDGTFLRRRLLGARDLTGQLRSVS